MTAMAEVGNRGVIVGQIEQLDELRAMRGWGMAKQLGYDLLANHSDVVEAMLDERCPLRPRSASLRIYAGNDMGKREVAYRAACYARQWGKLLKEAGKSFDPPKPNRSYRWDAAQEEELIELFVQHEGDAFKIALALDWHRTPGAIEARINKLGLR